MNKIPQKTATFNNSLKKTEIKVFPTMGFDAIHQNHGGSWRLWSLCKKLDEAGAGWISAQQLRNAVKVLGLNPRVFRLWLADALKVGLLIEAPDSTRYYIVAPSKAAALLNCPKIGRPVAIPLRLLFGKGWRASVWAAYLTTLNGKPVSQKTKKELTRVAVRTQRRYQRKIRAKKIINIAELAHTQGELVGLGEFDTRAIYQRGGKIVQRLPDAHLVDPETARALPAGRSRKEQARLNNALRKNSSATSFSLELGKTARCSRLFYETSKGAVSAARRLAKSDDVNVPFEVFAFKDFLRGVSVWQSITV